MRTLFSVLVGVTLAGPAATCRADGMPPIPDDHPSHLEVGKCNQERVRQQLQDYNETRLALSTVLRHMANDPVVEPLTRERLIGYAANLENMHRQLPPPDPDSTEFRNFDFRLGITLTSMTLFLNTEDPGLTQRFVAERDNPHSELGIYLAKLDTSRTQYLDGLAASRQSDCQG